MKNGIQLRAMWARACDTKQLYSYDDLYESIRLDYSKSRFNPEGDESLGVIRFRTQDYDLLKVPYGSELGGDEIMPPPFTGNGFTAAQNGAIIPEYYMQNNKSARIMEGAELFEVFKDGREVLRAIFTNGRFVPVN